MLREFLRKYKLTLFLLLLILLVWFRVEKKREGLGEGLSGETLTAIENLGNLATQLKTGGGLTIPGNLKVLGTIVSTGAITTDSHVKAKGAITTDSHMKAKGTISTDSYMRVKGDFAWLGHGLGK